MEVESVDQAVFVTIPLSHYCEKARWALDRVGLPYREEPHAPLFHRLATARGQGSTVPVLIHRTRCFVDSNEIMRHADESSGVSVLYPAETALRDEVEALNGRFDSELGPHVRRWAYAQLLADKNLIRSLWQRGVPRLESTLVPLIAPVARRLVRRAYRISAQSALRSLDRVHTVFSEVDQRLRDGRTYLSGERFTAADLTFAALAAPAVFPAECRAVLPAIDQVPAAMRDEINRLRNTQAGRFALRMYGRERGVSANRSGR